MKGKKTGGKVKGSINKFTKSVKDVFKDTFEGMQTDPKVKLGTWGRENPTEFYKLCGKLIPTAVDATVTMKKLGADLEEETYE